LEPAAEVGVDFFQPGHLGRVDPEERASDAGLTEMILSSGMSPGKTPGVAHGHKGSWQRVTAGRGASLERSTGGRRTGCS
jgi:hypothetical protein